MTRKLSTLLAISALATGASAMTAAGAFARPGPGNQSHQKKVCGDDARDHGDCGKGNAGDPGNGGGENPPQDTHRDAQIFSPPYLFKGARPQITSACFVPASRSLKTVPSIVHVSPAGRTPQLGSVTVP